MDKKNYFIIYDLFVLQILQKILHKDNVYDICWLQEGKTSKRNDVDLVYAVTRASIKFHPPTNKVQQE